MKETVNLSLMADPPTIFAMDTASDGRITGLLIGVTDDVGGDTLPGGNIAHTGIVMSVRGRAICIPVGRSVYEKFLLEVKRRHIHLVEREL